MSLSRPESPDQQAEWKLAEQVNQILTVCYRLSDSKSAVFGGL